jgi:hypothetical protein
LENVDIFYGHLEYFTSIWHKLWPFGIVYGHLVYCSHFGMFGRRKIWQPCLQQVHEKMNHNTGNLFSTPLSWEICEFSPILQGQMLGFKKKLSPKNLAKIWAFFAQNKAKPFKNLTITMVFEKTPIFSQKIVENHANLCS